MAYVFIKLSGFSPLWNKIMFRHHQSNCLLFCILHYALQYRHENPQIHRLHYNKVFIPAHSVGHPSSRFDVHDRIQHISFVRAMMAIPDIFKSLTSVCNGTNQTCLSHSHVSYRRTLRSRGICSAVTSKR